MKNETMNTLKLSDANKLEKRVGAWIWDGLLFNRDGITDPELTILPNAAGGKIRSILKDLESPFLCRDTFMRSQG